VQAFEEGKAAKAGRGTLANAGDRAHDSGDNMSKDMEASMWPALYMLEAYVRLFNSRGQAPDVAT